MTTLAPTTPSSAHEAPRVSGLAALLLASRPRTLPLAVAPVMVGVAVAARAGALRVGPAVACALGAALLQIGANFANDLFDFQKGADTAARTGPLRATQAGLLTPAQMALATTAAFALATAVGAYLAVASGPWVVAVGVASILAAVLYTGGRRPYGYLGLGEVFVFLFFGLVAVAGTAVACSGRWQAMALLAAVPVGALASAVLVVNNVRDVETDRQAMKRTVIVRFGVPFGHRLYGGLEVAAVLATLALAVTGHGGAVLALATVPLLLRNHRVLAGATTGVAHNALLARTALVTVLYAALLSIGLLAG